MAKIENSTTPKVGVIMGSVSDWETMKEACDVLEKLQVLDLRSEDKVYVGQACVI